MSTSNFITSFQDILQRDDAVTTDMVLKDMEEWDSLSFMATIAFFDRAFKRRITFEMLRECRTVSDLIALAQQE